MSNRSKEEKSVEDKREKFLAELTDLSKKYGFEIGGCGCCGSPWVTEMSQAQLRAQLRSDSLGRYEYTDRGLEYI